MRYIEELQECVDPSIKDWECACSAPPPDTEATVHDVAAKVLRDVCQFLSSEDQSITGYSIGTRYAAIIHDWADEKGINLRESKP